MSFHVPEKFRITTGPAASSAAFGNNGAFDFPAKLGRPRLFARASDGDGWEHVSVSTTFRCPTWGEMCWIKSLFWDDEDCVLQFHPPRSEYVNAHPFCLHLWRPISTEIVRPPTWMIGPTNTERVRAA